MDGKTKERLEYLRGELRGERISYGELAELQSLAEHIEPGDVELLEAAGVPEHEQETFNYGETPHEKIRERIDALPEAHGAILSGGTFSPPLGPDDALIVLDALLTDGNPSAVALRVRFLAALGIEES